MSKSSTMRMGLLRMGFPGGRAPSGTRPFPTWPIYLLALPAFVAIWSGWVGIGQLTGFGKVNLLPGIGDGWVVNTAITLPIGMETYAAYAIGVWMSGRVPDRARRFARNSAIGSLAVGAVGQVAYHLMAAAHVKSAPWPVTIVVACIPVAVCGMGAGLAHLVRQPADNPPAPDLPEWNPAEDWQVAELEAGQLPAAPVSPAPGGRRQADDRWEAIQRIRAANPGITQKAVAGMLGVSPRTVRYAIPAGVTW